jgi:hypothetical protein
VIIDRLTPPIPTDIILPPALISLIHSCHTFEPEGRPSFADILRQLRDIDDAL